MNVKNLLAFFILFAVTAHAQNNPVLLLSKADAANISAHLQDYSVLGKSYQKLKQTSDYALANKADVPMPVDNGGGYTHEKHKQNYRDMYAAGTVYAVTGNTAYAKFIENMLLEYAKMYPGLPLHPQSRKDNFSGKLFWQSLNDYVWLVYTIQAYDLVKETISPANRIVIERDVFSSMVTFISESEGGKHIFNMIHNHGTWAVAAVGMTGYVLNDKDMTERALYGSDKDKKTGFIRQIDDLFSPDGYYSEGPYYQRYALQPFMVFAEAINNNQPELKIFDYRNKVLRKAANIIFQLTDDAGLLLPFNDALKEKSILSEELIIAADIAYKNYKDSALLPIIQLQDEVMVNSAGLAASQDIKLDKQPFIKQSAIIGDGANGQSGGVAILRLEPTANTSRLTLVFKYASQGMGHGHYDRLGIQLYDGTHEILTDYGAARFINIEAKNGGRYLKENDSYAQQSVAHNTVIANEDSHYGGDWKKGQEHSPQLVFSDIARPQQLQIVSAKENNAYAGIAMQRTVTLVGGDSPFVIDVYSLRSKEKHRYDLNFMYSGQVMETDFKYEAATSLNTLGAKNGYQHLWKLAEGNGNNGISTVTWLNDTTFYSIATLTDAATKMVFAKVGANDPNFNLRSETGYMARVHDKDTYTFVSVIMPHGNFNAVPELVTNSHSNIQDIKLLQHDQNYTAVLVSFIKGKTYILLFANAPCDAKKAHKLKIEGKEYTWKGNYKLVIQ